MNEPTRRVFFALWPSDALRRDLERETRHAFRHSGGRAIPARNLHVTLAFLGSAPEPRLADLLSVAREFQLHPFELEWGELKWWPRQELLCMQPTLGLETLQKCVQRLHEMLRNQGFAIEDRPFRAHITLARDVRRDPQIPPIHPVRWRVDRIELIESRTSANGSVYSVLSR